MAASRGKPDGTYTYGHNRLEVLSAFTNSTNVCCPAYRKAEDMNYHSVCLHVLADSIRRIDIGILVVISRGSKCGSFARFWEFVPGHVVGSLSVKQGSDDQLILQYVHGLYHELGIHDLTVQTDDT